jgi:hypothetical protein
VLGNCNFSEVLRKSGMIHPNTTKTFGDIGIEVELEGALNNVSARSPLWMSKPEGSLRGGSEFILRHPVPYEGLSEALGQFDFIMRGSRPIKSIRTSTHIHISILDLTLKQIYSAMMFYYLVEELLVSTQSDRRQGNLFCLTLSRSMATYIYIMENIRTGQLAGYSVDTSRYSALNLVAMWKFGSLEFRFLDAMTTGPELDFWARLLYDVVHNGAKRSPLEMLEFYDSVPVSVFLRDYLGDRAAVLIDDLSDRKVNRLLHTNYDAITSMGRLMERPMKYQTSSHWWKEDVEFEAARSSPYKKGLSAFVGVNPFAGDTTDAWVLQHAGAAGVHIGAAPAAMPAAHPLDDPAAWAGEADEPEEEE